MKNPRYELGLKTLKDLHGEHVIKIFEERRKFCPEIVDMDIEWCFGEIASRTGIDYKTRELVIIASCITLGHAMPQLRVHLETALKVGASKEEIIEVFLQMIPYAGMAAVHNAMTIAEEVFSKNP
jgi:4-carboxymuconolactone decarboxylase